MEVAAQPGEQLAAGPAGPGLTGVTGWETATAGATGAGARTEGGRAGALRGAREEEAGRGRQGEPLEQLKEETAQELGLADELEQPEQMTTQEAGRIGGQMVRKLVERGKKDLEEEGGPQPANPR